MLVHARALLTSTPQGITDYVDADLHDPDKILEGAAGAAERLSRGMPMAVTLRTHAEVARFFDGLDLLEPGLVQVHRWRPDPGDTDLDRLVPIYGGVARKS